MANDFCDYQASSVRSVPGNKSEFDLGYTLLTRLKSSTSKSIHQLTPNILCLDILRFHSLPPAPENTGWFKDIPP